jgi:hypothetical protein
VYKLRHDISDLQEREKKREKIEQRREEEDKKREEELAYLRRQVHDLGRVVEKGQKRKQDTGSCPPPKRTKENARKVVPLECVDVEMSDVASVEDKEHDDDENENIKSDGKLKCLVENCGKWVKSLMSHRSKVHRDGLTIRHVCDTADCLYKTNYNGFLARHKALMHA